MAKNNQVIKMLKMYQERERAIVPEMYASFVLALNDMKMIIDGNEVEFDAEDIKYILGMTQAFWDQALDKRKNLVEWAEEVVDIDLHTFDLGKAKVSR